MISECRKTLRRNIEINRFHEIKGKEFGKEFFSTGKRIFVGNRSFVKKFRSEKFMLRLK